MEKNFGGPVWHASIFMPGASMAFVDELIRKYLEGVGDAALGEWWEVGANARHCRRRLSMTEVISTGLVMRDLRNTIEGRDRLRKLFLMHPETRQLAKMTGEDHGPE